MESVHSERFVQYSFTKPTQSTSYRNIKFGNFYVDTMHIELLLLLLLLFLLLHQHMHK